LSDFQYWTVEASATRDVDALANFKSKAQDMPAAHPKSISNFNGLISSTFAPSQSLLSRELNRSVTGLIELLIS